MARIEFEVGGVSYSIVRIRSPKNTTCNDLGSRV